MKITKRRLVRIIKEVRGEMKVDRMRDAMLNTLEKRPGITSAELVGIVGQRHRDIQTDDIYNFLDDLEANGEVIFDIETEGWSLR
tara:strand:- start:71 stop:325 length:255 start_codon:yes stop_codon:yes gene_type:complete